MSPTDLISGSSDAVTVSPASSPPSVSASSPDSDSPNVDGKTPPVQCTVDSQFSACNVCSGPVLPSVCMSCINDLNADMRAQTDSKLKLIAQRQVDELKLENGVMRAATKEQAKRGDSSSGRLNELLKRRPTKQPVTQHKHLNRKRLVTQSLTQIRSLQINTQRNW